MFKDREKGGEQQGLIYVLVLGTIRIDCLPVVVSSLTKGLLPTAILGYCTLLKVWSWTLHPKRRCGTSQPS